MRDSRSDIWRASSISESSSNENFPASSLFGMIGSVGFATWFEMISFFFSSWRSRVFFSCSAGDAIVAIGPSINSGCLPLQYIIIITIRFISNQTNTSPHCKRCQRTEQHRLELVVLLKIFTMRLDPRLEHTQYTAMLQATPLMRSAFSSTEAQAPTRERESARPPYRSCTVFLTLGSMGSSSMFHRAISCESNDAGVMKLRYVKRKVSRNLTSVKDRPRTYVSMPSD